MLGFWLAVILGLVVLVKAADWFVAGASDTAKLLGMPPLLIGMVIVGFGTSAPELTVSAISAYDGAPEIALGNAYGSNTANILLILGFSALIAPVSVQRGAIVRELPLLLAGTLASFAVLANGAISRLDAVILLVIFAVSLAISVVRARHDAHPQTEENTDSPRPNGGKAAGLLALGLILLVVSSKALVWGATGLARAWGVSELLIGLTIVAVGTSLPELASSVVAALRHEDDLAVGNIIGSNVFNTLAVVGLAGVIRPMEHFNPAILYRDLPVVLASTILLFVCGFPWKGRDRRISRTAGAVFLVLYIAYTAYILIQKS